jgi:hypothetical protein
MRGSMLLLTMSKIVITILHYAEVVDIPHEKWFCPLFPDD